MRNLESGCFSWSSSPTDQAVGKKGMHEFTN